MNELNDYEGMQLRKSEERDGKRIPLIIWERTTRMWLLLSIVWMCIINMNDGSLGCIETWKLGLGRQSQKYVRQAHETPKPKSVERYRVSVKGNIAFICVSRECAP